MALQIDLPRGPGEGIDSKVPLHVKASSLDWDRSPRPCPGPSRILLSAFLMPGRPRGRGKALQNMGDEAPHILEGVPGPPGPARPQKAHPQKIRPDCLQVPRQGFPLGLGSEPKTMPRTQPQTGPRLRSPFALWAEAKSFSGGREFDPSLAPGGGLRGFNRVFKGF
jgi:hypothetical protein